MVELEGLKYSMFYFKLLFDKIEVMLYIFCVGIYKFVVELLICDEMFVEVK